MSKNPKTDALMMNQIKEYRDDYLIRLNQTIEFAQEQEQEAAKLREQVAVLQYQVDNADINLEQLKMSLKYRYEKHLTHPQIHMDYYDWLGKLPEFDKNFIIERGAGTTIEEKFQNAHGIAMYAWSRSRETIKSI